MKRLFHVILILHTDPGHLPPGVISYAKEVSLLAKGKYEYWLTEDGQALLKDWARNGATDEQIAEQMQIHVSTLYDWKNKYPEINEALKETREICDSKVEGKLYELAMDGDKTAIIFYLKNRRRDRWRDNPDIDVSAEALTKAAEILGGVDSAID